MRSGLWGGGRREVDPEPAIGRKACRFSRTLQQSGEISLMHPVRRVNLDGPLAVVLCLTAHSRHPEMALWPQCMALDPEDGFAYEPAGFARRVSVSAACGLGQIIDAFFPFPFLPPCGLFTARYRGLRTILQFPRAVTDCRSPRRATLGARKDATWRLG